LWLARWGLRFGRRPPLDWIPGAGGNTTSPTPTVRPPDLSAKGAEPEHGRVGADQFVWDGEDDPVELPAGKPSERAILRRPKRGRHPDDAYAALLLAVIFHEAASDRIGGPTLPPWATPADR
jgi:hypothetical protein